MAQKLFSASLPDFNDEIKNPGLRGSLFELYQFLGVRTPRLKVWNDGYVAFPIKLKIDLPSLGNHNDLDIRPVEPVIIVFNLLKYPAVPPTVYTDRLDFPKDQLAHLYVAKKDRPPAFCLVRGSMADWYASKRPADLPVRIRNWLRDAALGRLTENGNQFDPLRIEGYVGHLVYDYDQFAEVVQKNQSYQAGNNFALAVFKRTASLTFKFQEFFTMANQDRIIKLLLDAAKENDDDSKGDLYHIGYVIWDENAQVFSHYQIDHPETWEDFKTYAAQYGINLAAFEAFFVEKDLNRFQGIPVVLAIRRPAVVIGYSQPIEFSNYMMSVDTPDKADGKLANPIKVFLFVHNQPLTVKLAREISGITEPLEGINMVVGCGALGSKIVMHLGRSGQTDFLLVDPDKISPHNLVRHALLQEQIGINKAKALAESVKEMFPGQTVLPANVTLSDPNLQDEVYNNYKWIFDFTASEGFYTTLINARQLKPNVCRASLSDKGNLGIMFIEGKDRNPRLDDLQASLYQMCGELEWVKNWLQTEQADDSSGNVMLTVGVGCNSETTLLADDKISTHAAYFSSIIKRECTASTERDGKIFISRIDDANEYKISTQVIPVLPFVSVYAKNGSGWELRFRKDIVEIMKAQMGIKMPNETGGVFLGSINYKTKTIHIVDIITEPADSTSDEICFHRGINGLPERVKEVHDNSGGQLGYIGEWHTHPFGPNTLSSKDLQTARKFKSKLDQMDNPLPVFITVLTPTSLLPFVF